jgi:hypothetical protein
MVTSRYLSKESIVTIVIFAASFLLRVLTLDSDLYGDEAYYYYLSLFPAKYVTLHRNHPPLLYLLYYPFAASVTTFRLINILVGSLVPVVIYFILRTYQIREEYCILGAGIIVFQYLFVRYSAIVFLDMLSVFFILLGYLFYRKKQFLLCGISLGLSCFTKEYALFAASILIIFSLIRHRSIRTTLLCASGTIFSAIAIYIIMFPLGGIVDLTSAVEHTSILANVNMIFLYLCISYIPFLLIVLWHGHYEETLIPIAYTIFIFFFSVTSNWYLIMPLAFLVISLVLAINYIYPKASSLKWTSIHINKTRAFAFIYLLLLLLATIQISATCNFITTNHSHELQDTAQFVINHYSGHKLVSIDCFWATSLYPFGIKLNVTHYENTVNNQSVLYYRELINDTGLAVIAKEGGNSTIKSNLLQFYSKYIVEENSEYVVIEVK